MGVKVFWLSVTINLITSNELGGNKNVLIIKFYEHIKALGLKELQWMFHGIFLMNNWYN